MNDKTGSRIILAVGNNKSALRRTAEMSEAVEPNHRHFCGRTARPLPLDATSRDDGRSLRAQSRRMSRKEFLNGCYEFWMII